MIKKIRQIYKPYMTRPMLYQSGTKIVVALVLCLLWDKFINTDKFFSMVESAFFVAGCFFLMLTWFQYLKLDGVTVHHLLEDRKDKKKKAKRHTTKDMVDFTDEKVVSLAELEEDEKVVCRFLGNLLCGALFLIPALIASVI